MRGNTKLPPHRYVREKARGAVDGFGQFAPDMGQVQVHGRQVSEQVLILDLELHQVSWLLVLSYESFAQVLLPQDVRMAFFDLASFVQDS